MDGGRDKKWWNPAGSSRLSSYFLLASTRCASALGLQSFLSRTLAETYTQNFGIIINLHLLEHRGEHHAKTPAQQDPSMLSEMGGCWNNADRGVANWSKLREVVTWEKPLCSQNNIQFSFRGLRAGCAAVQIYCWWRVAVWSLATGSLWQRQQCQQCPWSQRVCTRKSWEPCRLWPTTISHSKVGCSCYWCIQRPEANCLAQNKENNYDDSSKTREIICVL